MYKQSSLQQKVQRIYQKKHNTTQHNKFRKPRLNKMPYFLGFIVLLTAIIVLPALIVVIPNQQHTENGSMEVSGSVEETSESMAVSPFDVEVERASSGEVEKVPLEDYVTSVVASEMPAEFEEEALKAQAIAARTYVVNHLLHTEDKEQVISDQTSDQVYLDKDELRQKWGKEYSWKMDKVSNAVQSTENKIITYDAEPITPTFFSMSNGYTEDAEQYWGNELPYLKSVESKWEEDNPNFVEQKILKANELADKIGISIMANEEIPIELSRTPSHRVAEMKINGEKYTGKEIREKLALRSNDFTVKQKDDHFIFTTKGYGHGVGMSQYGANGMAEEGKEYQEILQYYYQGVELQSMKEAVPTLVSK